jgi:integrase
MRRQEAAELFLMDLSRQPEGMLLRLRRKGDKEGHILLPQKLEDVVMHHIETLDIHGPLFPAMRRLPSGKVIVLTTPITPDSITKIVRDMTREALGTAYGPHKLRHFFANATWDQGGVVEDIQRQLGHEDQRTTLGYLQRKLRRDRSVAELLDLSDSK